MDATLFMIREGESLADAYGRLGALRVKVKGLGCEKYNDGFEMNEEFIKSKVIAMIAVKQKDTNLALNLQILTKQADLNADDLVSYVAANESMAKAGEKLMAMNHIEGSSHNLALKARADQEREEAYEIEEDEMISTSGMQTDVALFVKKYVNKFPVSSKYKKRTCYNCDGDSHFANECPYEKRVDKPKFVKEGEDDEKEAGVAGLAYSEPGSLFTYDYSKDYSMESSMPNDIGSSFMARTTHDDDSDDISPSTIVGSCLMAREAKSKDETYREFIIFAKKDQRMYESEIKAIRTNNGPEFKNYTMQDFVDDEGIKHEFSAPYTPQQNGNKPNVMYIRVFGCKCLVKDNRGKFGKFEDRIIEATFVGYAENSHAYRYYKNSTRAIERSCDMVFLEDNGSQVEQVVPCVAGDDDLLTPSSLWALDTYGPHKFILMIKMMEQKSQAQPKWSLAQLKLNHQVQLKIYPLLKMGHIPNNKKKALNPLSKTMMLIKKHPQPMVELKLSLMIKY
ncbi:hypothetical protein QYE76_005709 [Lolium multiflorum]|uniref:CCHC-type domain-containing protein n=1 Tax=Lolium multiflorum TaxID=4521 RepID=A0AAD8RV97_LOLMU|nr:hypothetical protein QYE76_005709 [Lolium multiflorum]